MAPPHPQQPEEESDRGHGRTPDWFVGYPPIGGHQGDGPKESDQQRSLAQGVPIGISEQSAEHRQDELTLRDVPRNGLLEITRQKDVAYLDQENGYEASKCTHRLLLATGIARARSHGDLLCVGWPVGGNVVGVHVNRCAESVDRVFMDDGLSLDAHCIVDRAFAHRLALRKSERVHAVVKRAPFSVAILLRMEEPWHPQAAAKIG